LTNWADRLYADECTEWPDEPVSNKLRAKNRWYDIGALIPYFMAVIRWTD
jgi:hypothetical protein